MSFGDDTLAPETIDERELRLLREQDAAVRREVGANDGCCAYHEDHSVHDDVPGDHYSGTCNGCVGDLDHHAYREPESTLAAVTRVMEHADAMCQVRALLDVATDGEALNEIRDITLRDG